jgi:hypothetical protein
MEGLDVSFNLRCDFDAIPIRIEHDALVVAVAGPARSIQDGKAIAFEPLRERVDKLLGANRDCDVCKPHALCARFYGYRRKCCCLHRLDARAIGEAKEAGFKPFGCVHVSRARNSTEVRDIELLTPFEIGGPKGDVFDAHVDIQ